MKIRIFFIAAVALLCQWTVASGQITAESAFTTSPRHVFPMLSENAKLDMVDYFHSTVNKGAQNTFGGKSVITSLSADNMTVAMTEASNYQLALLPAGNDTLIVVITTVATPAPDSKMSIYSSDWKRNMTQNAFRKPVFREWLNDEGLKNQDEVEASVPFLLISYSFDPVERVLTLTNNTRSFLSHEIYEMVAPYLIDTISYKFDGKKFSKIKK